MIDYDISKSEFLKNINYPNDLKKLNLMDLRTLADEVREYLIDTISKIGGASRRITRSVRVDSCTALCLQHT